MRKIFYVIVIFSFVLSSSMPAFALNGNDTWVGGTSVNFADSNWAGVNNPPISGDSWEFGASGAFGTALNNNIASLSVAGITFDPGAPIYSLSGDSITLTGPISNNGSSNQILAMDIDGAIINNGTGTGETEITGNVDSSVSAITENSPTSALSLSLINVNAGGTTLTDTAGALTVFGGVSGTGNLTLDNNTATNDALSLAGTSVNNSGTITNSGTGTGETLIAGGVGSNVTGITEDSATSALSISTSPVTVNAGGTTLTDTLGTLTVSSGVNGGGNLILDNNTATANALSLTISSVNNSGTITNSGTGTGAAAISGGVGSNVTGIIENSVTSGLDFFVNPITVNSGGTTLAVSSAPSAGALTVNGGVAGSGNLILDNDTATADALYLDSDSVNNSGTITNSGTGTGETLIAGGVGSNVTGITENSATSALTIATDGLTVNSSGTALTVANGILTVSGGVNGTGNLVLNNNTNTNGAITLSVSSVDNTGTITNAGSGNGNTLVSSLIGSSVTGVSQDSGTSTLVLSNGSNAYTGATAITAGTLQTAGVGVIPDTSDVSISNGATLDIDGNTQVIGSIAGAGTVTSSVAGSTGFVDFDNSTTTFSGVVQDGSGQVEFIKNGTGTLSLSGTNTYSGGTIIASGAVRAENASALGTGFVTNDATLSLGTTSLSIGGVYTQSPGSILRLTISSPSTFGSITSPVAAVVDAGSAINVTVAGAIPNNTTFDIINTGGTGVGSAPATVTSTSSHTSFIDSIIGNNLILTADTIASYASLANNPNARGLGSVLDNMTSPSTDMTTILNALGGLSDAQATAALNTMGPIVDEGVMANTTASLNNVISATLDRIQDSLDHPASTGVSSGDDITPNSVWAKPYGSYLDQGTREGIQGYNSWNAGTLVGYDRMITDSFTLGASGGYAYGQVNSDANGASVDINSAQGTIYAGYQDPTLNYFIDADGSFAWNWYDGKRDINVGAINRTADSSYEGQQYGAYLDGGYKISLGGNLGITPLASIQWDHLSFGSYKETNANALDLDVNKQNYDILESGLGASITYKMQYNWGDFTPELHAKWLYDFINDDMQVTSTFSGGGGSFTSTGASPAKDAADIGGKLSFNLNNDLSLIAACDTELRDKFFGVYGSGTVHYKF